MNKDKRQKLGMFLVNLAAFVIIVAGMKAASGIVVQVLMAVFLAIIVTPLFFFLRRWHLPSWLALILIVLLLLVIGGLGVGVLGNSIASFTQNLSVYQERVQAELETLEPWLVAKGFRMPENYLLRDLIDTRMLFRYTGTVFNALGGMLGQILIVLLITVFFLLEAAMLPRKVEAVLGNDPERLGHIRTAVENVRRYMVLKTLLSMLTGFLVWILALTLRLDYPVLLGAMAFLLNYIPNVGSIMAAFPGVILALVQVGTSHAVWTAGGYIIINVGIGNIMEPKVMGRGFDMSPVMILISLLFWGWVLGPIGMLLSVPLTMSIKIAMQSVEETRRIALLLGGSVPEEVEAADLKKTEVFSEPR